MAKEKWLKIMEMVYNLVWEIDGALNEVDAEPLDQIGEDDHGYPDDWTESEENTSHVEVMDVCLHCGCVTRDLQYHLDQNVECRQAVRWQ